MTKYSIVMLIAAYLIPILYIFVGSWCGKRLYQLVAAFYIGIAFLELSLLLAILAVFVNGGVAAFAVLVLDILLSIFLAASFAWRSFKVAEARREFYEIETENATSEETIAINNDSENNDSLSFVEQSKEGEEIAVKSPQTCKCVLVKNNGDSLPKNYSSGVKSDSLLSPNWYLWIFTIKYQLSGGTLTVEAESRGTFSPWTDIFTPWAAATLKRKAKATTSGSASCTTNSKKCVATGVSGKNSVPDHEYSAAVVVNVKKDVHGNKHIVNLSAEAATAVAGQVAIQSIQVSAGTGSSSPVQLSGQLTINVPKGANASHSNAGEVQFRCDKVCQPQSSV